jgi:hypothetical protein
MNPFFSLFLLIWLCFRDKYNYLCNMYYLYYHRSIGSCDNNPCCYTASWASLLECSNCRESVISHDRIYVCVDCASHYYCNHCYYDGLVFNNCRYCDPCLLRPLNLVPDWYNVREHRKDFERRQELDQAIRDSESRLKNDRLTIGMPE